MVSLKAAKSVNDYEELSRWFVPLRDNEIFLNTVSRIAEDYTVKNQGATETIVNSIFGE